MSAAAPCRWTPMPLRSLPPAARSKPRRTVAVRARWRAACGHLQATSAGNVTGALQNRTIAREASSSTVPLQCNTCTALWGTRRPCKLNSSCALGGDAQPSDLFKNVLEQREYSSSRNMLLLVGRPCSSESRFPPNGNLPRACPAADSAAQAAQVNVRSPSPEHCRHPGRNHISHIAAV